MPSGVDKPPGTDGICQYETLMLRVMKNDIWHTARIVDSRAQRFEQLAIETEIRAGIGDFGSGKESRSKALADDPDQVVLMFSHHTVPAFGVRLASPVNHKRSFSRSDIRSPTHTVLASKDKF